MESDSERQSAYQKRRAKTQSRVTLWIDHDMLSAIDHLRGTQSRSAWINEVLQERTKDEPSEMRLLSLSELRTAP